MAGKITTREFWIKEPGRGHVEEGELEPTGPGEVRVRALFSGVSRGTESLVFRGEVPPSQRVAMRCPFQAGVFPAPVKYGYASVGVVEEIGGGVDRDLEGRHVFCLYPHQNRYVVPAAAVLPLPDALPPGRAVLAANMETAVNATWDARTGVGDRIAVVGGGVVGLQIGYLSARVPGARVLLIDSNPRRRDAAETLGLSFAVRPPEGFEADVVVHASGSPEGLADALALAGDEATIVEASWFGSRSVPLPLGEDFHARRLTLRSTQVGRVPPDRAPRWTTRRRLDLALRLLTDGTLDALITGESTLDELPGVMERLARDGGDTLCHRVRYEEE